jgi:glycosyltransferase involved in cell wall biosynthesis
MRILYVTQQYPPALGGAERYLADVAEAMAERSHRVDVLTTRSLDYHTWRNVLPAGVETIHGVRVHRFTSLPRRGHTWRLLHIGLRRYPQERRGRWMPLIWYGNGPIAPAMAWTILRRARAYDLVHINTLHYAHAWLAYRAATARRLPVVITPHIHTGQRDTYDVGYMRNLLQGCRAVIADTPAERAFVLAEGLNRHVVVGGYGLRPQNFAPQERAACRAHFGLPGDAFVVLFLGRKTEYKGLRLCLEAFAALHREHPQAYFLAVGPETDDSRRLWNHFAGLPNLAVYDAVSDAERLMALAACDVLAQPSSGEAFGIVYLEAWAYGKPVIGAAIDAIADLIEEGVDGFLVDPATPQQLHERLAQLAGNPQLAQAMGEQGRRKLHSRYTLDRTADVIEGTYGRVLRRERARRKGTGACAPA